MAEADATAIAINRSSFPSQTASLNPARAFVTTALTNLGFGQLIRSAELVISELASNAVENGCGDEFEVGVQVNEVGSVAIWVYNEAGDAAELPDRDEWGPEHPLAIRGRGLGIVDHIASSVTVEDAGRHITITAHLAA